ncbi:hypothetical protein [Streptomyces sp. Inha503]|uniref:hypothetical protein n=1 Tax=Streptomyces sp. Inha503 TaxID=3383314 RepID=UPI00399F324D
MTDAPRGATRAGPHSENLAEGHVGWRFKALPPQAARYHSAQIPSQRYRLFEDGFEWPVMVLKENALDANLKALAAFCDEHGALFAPHGKTTLSPALYARQEALGAWAVTVGHPSPGPCPPSRRRPPYPLRQSTGAHRIRPLDTA